MSGDSQNTQQTQQSESESQGQSTPGNMPEWVRDPERAWDAIQELRSENRNRRTENSSILGRLEQLSQTMNQLVPQEEETNQHDNPVDALAARLDSVQQSIEQERQQRVHAERQALRQQIANELNLPPAVADRIQGDTPEAMRADAESLAGLFSPPASEPEQVSRDTLRRNFQTTPIPSGQASANQDAERSRRYFGH